MVEKHKEENGELKTERETREKRDDSAGETDRAIESRQRERERKRERGSSASLQDNDRQCSKGQPHCTTRYCTIHRIHN